MGSTTMKSATGQWRGLGLAVGYVSVSLAVMTATLAVGCRRPGAEVPAPATKQDTTEVFIEERGGGPLPSFPGDFEPGPALPEPAAADPAAPGASYLALVEPRIQPRWRGFLDDCRLRLPPADALNNATLVAKLRLAIDKNGELRRVETLASSGNPDFDAAAAEIAGDAGPFAPPPRAVISDDEVTYLDWIFARDLRQAGAKSAALFRVEWAIGRAVPKLLAEGDVTEAALRLARHAHSAGNLAALDAAARDEIFDLSARVMGAAIREALLSEDPAVQRSAVAAAALSKAPGVARELRAIADGSLDLSLRGEAIIALAEIGDRDAAPLLAEIIRRDQGGNAEISAKAAEALAALGATDTVLATVTGWLKDKAIERQYAALVVTGKAELPSLTPTLVSRFRSTSDRAMRARLCLALGPAAAGGSALKALLDGAKDGDATVRAACAQAIARAAELGIRPRAAYWVMVEAIKDRDERVRAAAVTATTYLNPKGFVAEMYRVRGETSLPVLTALAAGLGRVPGADALARAKTLAAHENAGVRAAAIGALATRSEAEAKALAADAAGDPEARVRLAAVAALNKDDARLASLMGDDSPEVRAAAVARAVAHSGRAPALVDSAESVAKAPARSAERALLAAAWLAAK